MPFCFSNELVAAVIAAAIVFGCIYTVVAERSARRRDEAFNRKYRSLSVFGGGRIR